MLNSDVNTILSEKVEYDLYLFKQVLGIYLSLLLYPNSKDKRILLMYFYNDNVLYSKLEKEILKEIKKQKDNENIREICEEMIDKMDKIFFRLFNYNEWILDGFFDAFATNDLSRASLPPKKFDVLDENSKNEFVKKLKMYKD